MKEEQATADLLPLGSVSLQPGARRGKARRGWARRGFSGRQQINDKKSAPASRWRAGLMRLVRPPLSFISVAVTMKYYTSVPRW
ncbi:hypothetical protein E2C01_057543 [Portunus trituberculatus]|uniref:Uncharacterized protein n=1 Tax=Portunus trituberculatus TaxID=210409 RepID=A0A5B7H0S0_PORTR|nr:hypothetical protein [Portunus trituberculatus]